MERAGILLGWGWNYTRVMWVRRPTVQLSQQQGGCNLGGSGLSLRYQEAVDSGCLRLSGGGRRVREGKAFRGQEEVRGPRCLEEEGGKL